MILKMNFAGMGLENTGLKMEPGLVEWPGWYRNKKIPAWMTVTEVIKHGFNIDLSYKSKISAASEIDINETIDGYYNRTHNTILNSLKDASGKSRFYCPLTIVSSYDDKFVLMVYTLNVIFNT